jgi:hypothetical protein
MRRSRNVEREPDDRARRLSFRPGKIESFEGADHHFVDQCGAVDQRAVAIE